MIFVGGIFVGHHLPMRSFMKYDLLYAGEDLNRKTAWLFCLLLSKHKYKLRYKHKKKSAWALIHQADGRLSPKYREVSKPRDSGLDFYNRSEIWHAPRQ